MGMVTAQHVADAGCGLTEGPVRGQIILVHSVQNPPVNRLQTVTNIGQRTTDDNGHSILDVAVFHFFYKLGFHDGLIGIHDILGLVILFMLCQKNFLLLTHQ